MPGSSHGEICRAGPTGHKNLPGAVHRHASGPGRAVAAQISAESNLVTAALLDQPGDEGGVHRVAARFLAHRGVQYWEVAGKGFPGNGNGPANVRAAAAAANGQTAGVGVSHGL